MCNGGDPYHARTRCDRAPARRRTSTLYLRDARWYRQLSRLLLERRHPAEHKRSNASRNLQKKKAHLISRSFRLVAGAAAFHCGVDPGARGLRDYLRMSAIFLQAKSFPRVRSGPMSL